MRARRIGPTLRMVCGALLTLIFLTALAADWVAGSPEKQYREAVSEAPSPRFWLGTDALGRDRFARLVHGARVSLLVAPAAALLAVTCAAAAGGLAAIAGRTVEAILMGATDLTLSMPWLFLLLTVRAALPLDVAPWISILLTFTLLGLLGWAAPARVIRTHVGEILASNYVLAARSRGLSRRQVLMRHVLPNTRPILQAQFWSSLPLFVLAEANLGLLGLGVAEPMPSWGTMLRELENCLVGGETLARHYWLLATPALIVLSILCLSLLFPSRSTK